MKGLSGASTQVSKAEAATSLRQAVNVAVVLFEGDVCLHLVDDLWAAQDWEVGYFDDLRQLFSEAQAVEWLSRLKILKLHVVEVLWTLDLEILFGTCLWTCSWRMRNSIHKQEKENYAQSVVTVC